MKTLITITAALAFAFAAFADDKPRQGHFLCNAEIPRNCVELSLDYVPKPDDFWQQPPSVRPKEVPATCVLVEVYQRLGRNIRGDVARPENQYGGLRFVGWTYIEAEDVNWLHDQKNASLLK